MKKTFLFFLLLFAVFSVTATESISILQEIKKLISPDGSGRDWFGGSLSIDNDIAVVGMLPNRDLTGPYEGYVYLFQKDLGGKDNWGVLKKLLPPDSEDEGRDNFFGASVVIGQNTVFVGDTDYNNDRTMFGSVHIFKKDEGGVDNWGFVKSLISSESKEDDMFGDAIAINGDTLVVGSPDDEMKGAVYILQKAEGGTENWGETQKLIASNSSTERGFGRSIVMNNEIIAIGSNNAVYLFQKDGVDGMWKEVKSISKKYPMLAIKDDMLAVGVPAESGAVYLFKKDFGGVNNWGEVQKLLPSDSDEEYGFGISTSFGNDFLLVGGSGNNREGAVYFFEENSEDNKFYEINKIMGSDNGDSGGFGSFIESSGNTVLVSEYLSIVNEGSGGGAYIFYKTEEDLGNTADSADSGNAVDTGNTVNTADSGDAGNTGNTGNTTDTANTDDSSDDGSACSVLII